MIFLTEEHLTTEDFDYELPEELIAQTPLEHRDQSRMLVLDSKTGKYQDDYFYNVIDRLEPGDALVMNDSRVLPARIYGVKPDTGGHLEVLLLNNIKGDQWETLIKPAKRAKVGTKISFGNGELTAVVKEELEHGGRIVEFEYDGIFLEVLESLGKCHYHHTSRKNWTILKCIKQFILKKSVLPLLLQLDSTSRKNYWLRSKLKVSN